MSQPQQTQRQQETCGKAYGAKNKVGSDYIMRRPKRKETESAGGKRIACVGELEKRVGGGSAFGVRGPGKSPKQMNAADSLQAVNAPACDSSHLCHPSHVYPHSQRTRSSIG